LVRWGIANTTYDAFLARETSGGKVPWLTGVVFNANREECWPLSWDQVDLQHEFLVQDSNYS